MEEKTETECNKHGFLREVSMFLVGFIMVLPLRLALACAKYALGGLAGFAVSNTIAAVITDKKAKAGLSVMTNWLMYLFSLLTLYIFTYGGDLGDPNLYLWTIVVHYFLVGLNVTFSNGVESDAVTYFNAGVPLSSVFVAIYHKVFLYFADKYLLQDVDYWIIFGQIVANCVFMYLTACCWTMHCGICHFKNGKCDKKKENGQDSKCNGSSGGGGGGDTKCTLADGLGHSWTWSPFMLTVFSLGAFYCVYPDNFNVGPGKQWSNAPWWNTCWAIEAYALLCVYVCYTILHYPDSFLGKLIIGNSALVGFMTVSFVTVQEGLKAVGLSAVGKQKNGKDIDNLSTITLAISLAILNFTNFLGDGYLQTYRKVDKENWPTEGYTRYRGFKFWFNAAFKLAKKNLLNAFNVDVRGRTLM